MPNIYHQLIKHLSSIRFFTVSLFIHLALVALVGTVVLFKPPVLDRVFVSPAQKNFLAEEKEDLGAETSEPLEFDEPSQPRVTATSVAAHVSIGELVPVNAVPGNIQVPVIANVSRGNSLDMPAIPPGIAAKGVAAGGEKKLNANEFFGTAESRGDALPGYFYDLKQDPKLRPTEVRDPAAYWAEVRRFVEGGFNPSLWKQFFVSPTPLYASQWTFPIMPAEAAPAAFSVQQHVQATLWVAHYAGRIETGRNGKIRFNGYGDNLLIVAIDGKVVLDASRTDGPETSAWKSSYPLEFDLLQEIGGKMVRGDWVEMRTGVPRKIDILIGESSGGKFGGYLLVERSGSRTDVSFPFFATAKGSLPENAVEPTVDPRPEIFKVR